MIDKTRVDDAVACFNEKFNCSQSILSTYCTEFGLDRQTALRLACGFGAGMGRLQETCGAVTGAYLLLGLIHGNTSSEDESAKEKTYALIREFSARFTEINKTTNCRELLGVDLINGNKQEASMKVRTTCPKMVRDAATIIEDMLFSSNA